MDMARLGEVFDLPSDGTIFQEVLERSVEEICVTIDAECRAVSVELHDTLILYSDMLYDQYGENYLCWQQEQQVQYRDAIHALLEQEESFAAQAGDVAGNLSQIEQEHNPLIREWTRWCIKKRNEFEALRKFSTLSRTMRFGIDEYEKNVDTDTKMQTLFAVAADHFEGLHVPEDVLHTQMQKRCVNMANQLSNKHSALMGTSRSIAKSLRRSFDFFYPKMPERYKP
ncbi:hypothetical protein COU78_05205 [Candidatus Peregrinibacteria bacterium CG10_big_fil_rev_8_21_14_0_10_49_24]|nr:MAG: hypothetical protein COV83_01575 [Candidatus Peregrinibacteria bacterium CG11_big_fil_rev_8_21_14_0_20_49_14]PIR50743.1 MAG: hypothetical protein COU78_05205 [Candidatus Peregrinibacteria bacterium CG10_big_fil_rev_8_21_14_0_10_49_24]PJA68212.1 MAG: hypothetical protein CO157_00605 [Candidatus Peregrinibacteria bacterium CG_4_9_14_3_um_filter_49_12]